MLSDALIKEVQTCMGEWPHCTIFDPDKQPSTARSLEDGWNPIVWQLPNGMTLSFGAGMKPQPLWSTYLPCPRHEEALIEQDGWTPEDGGERWDSNDMRDPRSRRH